MSFNNKPMTAELANQVHRVLVDTCGVRDDQDTRMTFVYEFTSPKPTSEFRFQGRLGFGGKFRFPRFSVDCYPEDETPERDEMIARANAELAKLRVSYEALV